VEFRRQRHQLAEQVRVRWNGCVKLGDALSELLIRHIREAVFDLHLLGLQFSGQAQPDVRHFLADLGEHSVTVLLKLAA
jgi:hypothetical protein